MNGKNIYKQLDELFKKQLGMRKKFIKIAKLNDEQKKQFEKLIKLDMEITKHIMQKQYEITKMFILNEFKKTTDEMKQVIKEDKGK